MRHAVVLTNPAGTMQIVITLTLVAVVRAERFVRWDLAVELCMTVPVNEHYQLHRHAGPTIGWYTPEPLST